MSINDAYTGQRDVGQYRNGGSTSRTRANREEGEGSHAREIELKRSRGEVSCAECRRLKIKCDRQLPCSSCLRRGCASLCPNGSLATGQGTRFVLAATDHLHRRIAKMSERIRQLEDALAIMQSHESQEAHPLLRDELLNLKVEKSELPEEADLPSTIEGMGTLSITDKGVRFFGVSGGPELMLADHDDDRLSSSSATGGSPAPVQSPNVRDSKSPQLPPELALFSNSFPFTPIGTTPEVKSKIEQHLPPWDAAVKLAETYLTQAAWLFRSVSRGQLMDELLPVVYKKALPSLVHTHSGDYEGPHALAIVFMCFAVGTLVDLSQEPYSPEADHYYNLAKAAIALQNVFERPELFSIQALHLMSIYISMRESRSDESDISMEMSWSLIRLCHQLSETIGLHRDSARWGLNPPEVERRRELFWDIFVADSWQSLATGRPPSITTVYIDCQFPQDEEAHLNEQGKSEPGFNTWMFSFVAECVSEVAAKTLTAVIPPYSVILALDAKIRDFSIPVFPEVIPLDPSQPAMVMARYAMSHCRETILLYLHRGFFAQAMTDDPVNPLRSQYAPSFLATYRSATHILKTIREEFELIPAFSARYWMPWTYAFSSAVVVGTVVTRGPSSTYAPSSLQELDNACSVFAKVGQFSRRAAKCSTLLEKLRVKAHAAYDACLHSDASAGLQSELQLGPKIEQDDELDLIGGRVKIVSSKKQSSNRSSPDAKNNAVSGTEKVNTGHSFHRPAVDMPRLNVNRVPVDPSPISPASSSVTSPIHIQNLSAIRSEKGGDISMSANDYQTYHDMSSYRDVQGAYTAVRDYPQTVKLDEWVPTNVSRHTGVSYSQSSRPQQGLDGLEYAHPNHATIGEQRGYGSYNPHAQRHANDMTTPDTYGVPFEPSPGAPVQGGAFYRPAEQEYFPTAPREFSEMGLASQQHSGLNQRWTHFMQDSFYNQHGQQM